MEILLNGFKIGLILGCMKQIGLALINFEEFEKLSDDEFTLENGCMIRVH